jgi:hypothetical protein
VNQQIKEANRQTPTEAYRPACEGGTGRNGKQEASTTSSSANVYDDVPVEVDAKLPMWLARNVRQVCDGAVSRSGRYRNTVRSETVIPDVSNSPWIRGAPQRRFAVAMRPMRVPSSESILGLPGRRSERRLQHPRNLRDATGRSWPAGQASSRPATAATTVASTARADGRTCGSGDLKASPIGRSLPNSCANVNEYARTRQWRGKRTTGKL